MVSSPSGNKFSPGNRVVATAAATKEKGLDFKAVEDSMLAGAFAGVIGRLVSAPLDLLKIRFQLQTGTGASAKYQNVWQAAKTIVKEEGLTSLWKGNLSATYLWVTYSIVQFGVYGALEEWSKSVEKNWAAKLSSLSSKGGNKDPFGDSRVGSGDGEIGSSMRRGNSIDQQDHGSNRFLHTFMLFLCGASAAILASSTTYPFDIMRTQFSLQGNTKIYASIPAFITSTLQKQGVKGFYAGLGPTLVGVTPYIGLNFALYDLAKKAIESTGDQDATGKKNNSVVNTIKKSIAGGFAGTTSKLMVYPLDTIKRRMQASVLQSTLVVADGAAAAPQYKNMLDCFSTICRAEGWQGLYRGVGPTILKSCVSTAITFAAYDQGLILAKKMRADREK